MHVLVRFPAIPASRTAALIERAAIAGSAFTPQLRIMAPRRPPVAN